MINSIFKYRIIFILFAILFLAGFIRFYRLAEFPVSLYWDEVSIANNANFLIETGKDEHGNSFPLIFKGFNDYKSPGNIYLSIIPIKLFGLNEFSARFTSAFLGTLLVLVMFFLGKNFAKLIDRKQNSDAMGLLSAFLLAIMPWHIQFSRAGFEANSGLFFVTVGITLFITFLIKKDFKLFFLAAFFFAFSCYFYRSVFIFSPLFFTALILFNYKIFFTKKSFKKLLFGLLIFVLVLIPFIPQMLSEGGMSRGNSVSILNPENSFERVVEISQKYEKSDKNLISKIIFNRRVIYVSLFLENYKSYFTPDFLFFYGDLNERHKAVGTGPMFLWQLPFLIIGIIGGFLIRKKVAIIMLTWLILAAIPAALSIPASHALRSLNMLPAYILIISGGIIILYKFIPIKIHLLFSIILAFIVVYSFVDFVNNYKNTTLTYSYMWGDGYRQLFNYISKNNNKYEKFIVSGHYWQPYAYALFYTKYDPNEYLRNGSKVGFDKFSFGGTAWEKEQELNNDLLAKFINNQKTLVILSPDEYQLVSKKIKKIDNIYNKNNKLVFIIGEYVK